MLSKQEVLEARIKEQNIELNRQKKSNEELKGTVKTKITELTSQIAEQEKLKKSLTEMSQSKEYYANQNTQFKKDLENQIQVFKKSQSDLE